MKQLALLMLAILILGCENQNPVAELDVSELDEEISELKAIADQLSQTVASLDRSVTTGTTSSVADGDTDVDPEPLNRDGIRITFSERIALSHFNLHHEDGTSLDWRTDWSADGQTVTLTPPHRCAVLRHGTTYTIDFVVQDFGSWQTEGFITFTTKPRPAPAAPLLDTGPPAIVYASMRNGDTNVDPEPLNHHGIYITFDERIFVSHFDLRLRDGPTLGWEIQQWKRDRHGYTVKLTPPPNECSWLRHGTIYVIDIFVQDGACETTEVSITFKT